MQIQFIKKKKKNVQVNIQIQIVVGFAVSHHWLEGQVKA